MLCAGAARAEISLASLGAPGAKSDCAPFFARAFARGEKTIRVPSGRWALSSMSLPAGASVVGEGASSILVSAGKGTGEMVRMGANGSLRDLALEGLGAKRRAVFVASPEVSLRGLRVSGFAGMGVETDHATDLAIEGCTFSGLQRAVNIVFSQRVRVLSSTVRGCTEHGLQFWGNWKWQSKGCSDLQFIGNTVIDGGGGAIWGTGAERVVVANNIVDGAEDVGIDLEWCQDSTISGNTVRRAKNAGISLFFACRNVSITGNTIVNDRPISQDEAKATWWVRAAIWLTDPNTQQFPGDSGHRDIAIVGNSISNASGQRRAMWIGRQSDNIALYANVVRGGKVYKSNAQSQLEEVPEDGVLRLAPEKH